MEEVVEPEFTAPTMLRRTAWATVLFQPALITATGIGLLDSAESLSLADELGAIRCPVLVVAAELDGFIPLDRCRALADAIPGAEFRVIAGAGHAVVVEDPAAVVALAYEFFEDGSS